MDKESFTGNCSSQREYSFYSAVLFSIFFIIFMFRPASVFGSAAMDNRIKKTVYQAHALVITKQFDMTAIQKAFETDPRFIDDERMIYVFMHSYNAEQKEAICIAQGIRPELIGKNMWSLRTPDGRLLFQEEIALIEKHEEFWLEYDWLNPFTETIQTKRSFFKRIDLPDGRRAWVGSGYWKNHPDS